jgi:VIT1/CCC1 family predicted Fe2+/Mn2+ transporter
VLAFFWPPLQANQFAIACVLTGLTLFVLGALKVLITGRNWFKAGLEMFLVGGVAALAAYLIGYALSGLAP